MSWTDRARVFAALHNPGDPLILFNAWDPGSAKVVAQAGARAIATGSWAVADAFGFADGETLPLELALDNVRRIVAIVDLPVTMDIEAGYGDPAATAKAAADAGAVGCNLEDRVIGGEGLVPVAEQAERLAAVRAAVGPDFFINARCDLFFQPGRGSANERAAAALERGRAYAEAGASGLFLPGLIDEALIERVCKDGALPVNILAIPGAPDAKRLAALGVARISHGSGPYVRLMQALGEAARAAYA